MAVEAAIASAVFSAAGSIQAGKDQKRAYNYNAQVNERNAQVADQDAEQLVLMEEVEIGRFRREFDNLQAATSQSFRFNGWMADTGTPLKVALANAQEADEEVAIRRYNAKVGKAELKEKGTQERMSANSLKLQIKMLNNLFLWKKLRLVDLGVSLTIYKQLHHNHLDLMDGWLILEHH